MPTADTYFFARSRLRRVRACVASGDERVLGLIFLSFVVGMAVEMGIKHPSESNVGDVAGMGSDIFESYCGGCAWKVFARLCIIVSLFS